MRVCVNASQRLTDYHVRAVEALGGPADLIGFHGQTILHQPHRAVPGRSVTHAIGPPTGLPVAPRFPFGRRRRGRAGGATCSGLPRRIGG